LILYSGEAVIPYLETIIEIMAASCGRDRDVELKLDSLVILERMLGSQYLLEHLAPLSRRILVNVVKSTASWKAGAAH
jgi:hypothetical protein